MKISKFPILDFFRIFTCLLIIFIFIEDSFPVYAFYPDIFWFPEGIMQFFNKSQITSQFIDTFVVGFWITVTFALIGLCSRFSLLSLGLILSLLYAMKMSFGFVNHRESSLIITVFILSAYPVNRNLSLDRYIFKKLRRPDEKDIYGFLLCLRVLLCIVYCSAGISKLQAGGLDWVTTSTLQNYLRFCDFTLPTHWSHSFWPHAGFDLAQFTTLCHLLAALTVTVELASPLALFIRRVRYPIIFGLLFLQISTVIFLNISFIHLAPLYLAWLPWEKLFLQSRHKMQA